MQKIKNKFIYFIIFLILLIIGYSIYSSLFEKSVDRNSYVQLINGEGLLNDNPLYVGSREKLEIQDIIKTTTNDSLAIIEWGDGSITRLGGNTSIKVEELFVSNNKEKLNIAFELFSGKTWSNVISYIPEESYFKEIFKDSEAAVRGTVFNLDLDNDYLYVLKHGVEIITKNGEILKVEEKKPLKLSNFSFLKLEQFIKEFKDSSFDEINRVLDKELLEKLKLKVQDKVKELTSLASKEIEELSLVEKKKLYKEMVAKYQELNFISSNDSKELYDLKIGLKEKLLQVAPEGEKQKILSTFVYDLKDSLRNKSSDNVNKIFEILEENKTYINEDLKNFINSINVKDYLDSAIFQKLKTLKDILSDGKREELIDKVGDIKNTIEEASDKAKDSIKEGLNNFINN